MKHLLRAGWSFARPHTVIGTSLSVVGIAVLASGAPAVLPAGTPEATGIAAVAGAPTGTGVATSAALAVVAATLVAALAANVYIVGLNQIVDVNIDLVNKPRLPLPAGKLTRDEAMAVVAASGAVAIGLGAIAGAGGGWLVLTLSAAMLIGSAYSLPPLHLKFSPVGAPLSIGVVRGPIVTLGLYAHFQHTLGAGSISWTWIVLLTVFMTLFGLAIGVAKDLPDFRGDLAHDVTNLAVVHGPDRALTIATWLLVGAYVLTAVVAVLLLPPRGALLLTAAHGVALWLIARRVQRVNRVAAQSAPFDAAGQRQVSGFYRGVWRLFYTEAVVIPVLGVASVAFG